MKRTHLPVLLVFLSSVVIYGEITLSKDSLWVSNNLAFSRDDAIIIHKTGTDSVALDSATIDFTELDTTGFSFVLDNDQMHLIFSERHGNTVMSSSYTQWPLEKTGNNRYRMLPGTTSVRPLVLTSPEDTVVLGRMQIGYCLICNRTPLYPEYLRGVLHLFFTNQQIINITLYSSDLRQLTHVQQQTPHSVCCELSVVQDAAGLKITTAKTVRTVSLFDASGRFTAVQVTSSRVTAGILFCIPVNDLPGGIYFLRLVSSDHTAQVERILISH